MGYSKEKIHIPPMEGTFCMGQRTALQIPNGNGGLLMH